MYHVKTILKIVGSNKPEAVPCKHPSAVRMVTGRADTPSRSKTEGGASPGPLEPQNTTTTTMNINIFSLDTYLDYFGANFGCMIDLTDNKSDPKWQIIFFAGSAPKPCGLDF